MAIQVIRGTVTLANAVSSDTVSLPAGITQNKSVPIISIRGENTNNVSHGCSAELQTPVGGEWTQLLIQRGSPTLAATIDWEIWYGPELSVQSGYSVITDADSGQKNVGISTVDRAKSFLVVHPRRDAATGGNVGDLHIRGQITSTTNIQFNRERATGADCGVSWYVVEVTGAFVQWGTVTFAGTASQGATLGTPVVMANSILIYSSSSNTTSRPDRCLVMGQLTSTTALTFDKKDASTEGNGSVDWFVIEHPDFTVQRGTKTLADTVGSDTQGITPVADLAKTGLATNWYGSVNSDADALSTMLDGMVSQKLTAANTITFQRYGTALATYAAWQVVEFGSGYTPAVIAREDADIAAGEQTDTTAHVRVTSVDVTGTSKLYGHFSDLGTNPTTWVGTATEIDPSVTTNDLVAWTHRTPNTPYYFAIVTDDGAGGGRVLSNVLTITTAHARPTGVTIGARTSSSVQMTWTDQSGGTAQHQLFQKLATQPMSSLAMVTTIPAGQAIQYNFTGLTAGLAYTFVALAWDGSTRYSEITQAEATPPGARLLVHTTATLGGGSVPIDDGVVKVRHLYFPVGIYALPFYVSLDGGPKHMIDTLPARLVISCGSISVTSTP